MPWCEPCAKYWTPNAMNDDGSCPQCGEVMVGEDGRPHDHDAFADEKAPWHFKLMVVAVVAYLGWRIVELFA